MTIVGCTNDISVSIPQSKIDPCNDNSEQVWTSMNRSRLDYFVTAIWNHHPKELVRIISITHWIIMILFIWVMYMQNASQWAVWIHDAGGQLSECCESDHITNGAVEHSSTHVLLWFGLCHFTILCKQHFMMTSSNGSIFRVTAPFWGESTCHWWFPSQRLVTRSFDVFYLSEQMFEQTIETPVLWNAIASM